MTLDAEYATYQGKSVLVPGEPESERGQCVQWVDYVLHDVYALPYHYGNAIDWWNNPGDLLDHFNKITDGSVKKGDFVVFNQRTGSVYGHIDVAMQDGGTDSFQGADSNWGRNLTVHLVQHTNASQVLGSLRLKEQIVEPADYRTNEGDVINGFKTFGRVPSELDLGLWTGQPFKKFLYEKVMPGVAAMPPTGVKPYTGAQLYVKD